MARTSLTAVKDAIETSLEDWQVTAFIDDANVWVTARLASEGLSSSVLERIEKYLACHFVTLRDPRLRTGTFGDTTETYQRDTQVTEYLKSAAALDPTGTVEEAFIHSDKGSRFTYSFGERYVDEAGGVRSS